jgi:hypothetical protein
MLDLTADGKFGEIVDVTVGQEITQPGVTATNLTGPITCICQFGNGAATATMEFDVPAASITPTFIASFPNGMKNPPRSGAGVSLPAGSLRVFFRNDNNMLPAFPGGTIIGNTLAPSSLVNPTCFAFVDYGTTFGGRQLRKSICVSNNSAMAVGNTAFIGIPAFARRMYLYRDSLDTTTFSIFFNAGGLALGQSGPFVLGPGVFGPIVIPPPASDVGITYVATVGTNVVNAVFELEI